MDSTFLVAKFKNGINFFYKQIIYWQLLESLNNWGLSQHRQKEKETAIPFWKVYE